MLISRELSRRGDCTLIETQFVGVSGQVCSVNFQVDGPEKLFFATRAEAEAALWASQVDTSASASEPA